MIICQCSKLACETDHSADVIDLSLLSPAATTAIDLFGAVEKDPACGDVLVSAHRPVAPMRMGEGRGGKQNAAGPGRDFSLLVKKLRFAFPEAIIQIDRPEQRAVQCFSLSILWVELTMPIGIATVARGVALQVDGTRT